MDEKEQGKPTKDPSERDLDVSSLPEDQQGNEAIEEGASSIKTPEVPATGASEGQGPALSDFDAPDVGLTGLKLPEAEVPETELVEPEVPEPDVPKPELPKPEVPEPAFPETEVPEPEVPEPELPEPEVPEPALPDLESAEPEVAEPNEPAGKAATDGSDEFLEPVAEDSQLEAAPPLLRKGPRRPPYLMIASLTVLTILAANGTWLLLFPAQVEVEADPEPTEVLGTLIEAVRKGDNDTIEVTKLIVTDEEFEDVRGLEGLRILILDAGFISDKGMPVVATLSNLIHLRLRDSLITDDGIEHLLGLEKLRILNLPQANFTSSGVEKLAKIPSLRQLRIGGDGTTDISKSITTISNLRALHLIDVPVTDDGLRLLAKMPHLESLYLDNTLITQTGWRWLFENHPELHLHINQRHHDRDPNWHVHTPESDSPKDPEIQM